MIYFDTSYLVRLYYQEAGADAVRALAARDHVACAAHGQAGAFQWLAQDAEILSRIRHIYQRLPATVFLGAADAIHLATAAESGFRVIYSNDGHLLAAAKYFGIEGKNVIDRAP